MIFKGREQAFKNDQKSIYRNVNIYDKQPEQDLELDLAVRIYNDISDINHSVDWNGFKLMMDVYDIENIKCFVDYISIIKETINNFDRIYHEKTNTPEVQQMNSLIESYKRKGNKK